MQAVPQPYDQVSFQRDGREILRYHFAPTLARPFLFPVIGPSGRELTRMGHPGDPDGHSHHNSIWISFNKVNGADFWSDRSGARIVHQRVEHLEDGDTRALVITQAEWRDKTGKALLRERRHTIVDLLPEGEWLLTLDLALTGNAVFEFDGFGPIGVRVAKSISTHFGGGEIRNSEGGVNEAAIFLKRARWADYSGQVAAGVVEGLTLFDHPKNPSHPSHFHVREDGWMGAMLTREGAVAVTPEKPLRLRYGLYVHSGKPSASTLDAQWKRFAEAPLRPPLGPPATAADCQHGDHKRYTAPREFKSGAECVSFVKTGR